MALELAIGKPMHSLAVFHYTVKFRVMVSGMKLTHATANTQLTRKGVQKSCLAPGGRVPECARSDWRSSRNMHRSMIGETVLSQVQKRLRRWVRSPLNASLSSSLLPVQRATSISVGCQSMSWPLDSPGLSWGRIMGSSTLSWPSSTPCAAMSEVLLTRATASSSDGASIIRFKIWDSCPFRRSSSTRAL